MQSTSKQIPTRTSGTGRRFKFVATVTAAALLLTACEGSDSYKAGYRAGQGGVAYSQCSGLADISSMQDASIDAGDFTDGCQDAAGKPNAAPAAAPEQTQSSTANISGNQMADKLSAGVTLKDGTKVVFSCPDETFYPGDTPTCTARDQAGSALTVKVIVSSPDSKTINLVLDHITPVGASSETEAATTNQESAPAATNFDHAAICNEEANDLALRLVYLGKQEGIRSKLNDITSDSPGMAALFEQMDVAYGQISAAPGYVPDRNSFTPLDPIITAACAEPVALTQPGVDKLIKLFDDGPDTQVHLAKIGWYGG